MRRQEKSTQSNRSRKAKCDLIAEKLDENNIFYEIKVGINMIFQISDIEIIVSDNNIIIKNGKQEIDFNNEVFWKELNKILEDSTLKKSNR